MIKNQKNIWRIIAIICTLVWTIVLFAVNAFTPNNVNISLFNIIQNNILYGISIAISIILIFFPMQFYLYTIKCWLWGLVTLILTSGTPAVLMYLLGCAFAYRMFSSKNGHKKYLMLILPLFIVIAFQYRLGVDVLVESILILFFLGMFFTLVYILLVQPIVQQNRELSDKIVIADCDLTELEFALLQSLLSEKTYKAICYETGVSESSVKKRIRHLLRKINVENRGTLLSLNKKKKILY